MSSLNHLEYAVHFNNKACEMIRQTNYVEAIQTLMTALKETKKRALQVRASSSPHECSSHATLSPATPERIIHHTEGSKDTSVSQYETEMLVEFYDRSHPYMFQEPIHIVPQMCADGSISRLSFFIMVNLGIANHMKAMQEGSHQSLEIARKLYELSFQMQSQECESNLVLTAALLNNLALVHDTLDNVGESIKCKQHLLSALLLLVDLGSDATSGYEKDLEGFMGNVTHLIAEDAPVARAA